MPLEKTPRSEFTANLSAPLVFPIASLAFCYPCDRCGEALSSGFLALGLRNPFDVILLVAVAKIFEGGQRQLVLFQSSQQIIGDHKFCSRLRLWSGYFSSCVIEP